MGSVGVLFSVWMAAQAAVAPAPASGPCAADVTVRGHALPGHVDSRALATEMQAIAPALFSRAADVVGLETCPHVDVDLVGAIEGARLLDPPWHLPDWAAGAAQPGERRVVLGVTAGGQRQDRERVLLHELVHVAVTEKAGRRVPRWLDEGIARVAANEDGSDQSALARARLGDRLLPLAVLDAGFPRRADLAQLAYAESARAVAAIHRRGGPDAVPRLLTALGEGADIDAALVAVTGRRLWQLDLDVERAIPTWQALAVVGVETDLAYAACAVVMAWAGMRARRRQRERMTALDADDGVPPMPTGPPSASLGAPVGVVLVRWRESAS